MLRAAFLAAVHVQHFLVVVADGHGGRVVARAAFHRHQGQRGVQPREFVDFKFFFFGLNRTDVKPAHVFHTFGVRALPAKHVARVGALLLGNAQVEHHVAIWAKFHL